MKVTIGTRGGRLARRLGAAGVAVAAVLLLPLAAVAPAAAAAGPARLLPVAAQKPVPVHAVPSHPVKVPVGRRWQLPPTTWPAPGSVTVPVAAGGPASRTARSAILAAAMALPTAGSSRAGTLPVWVGPQATGASAVRPAAGDVRVTMASRQAAARAGITGVIFTVAQSGSAAAARRVHVSLDYSSFAYADGGDFAARLRLVKLPACVLTTPAVASCRREVPLASSSDDVQQDRLGADLALSASASPAVVLAAATSTSGSAGNYSATPLSEAGEWSAGGSSGAFTYSYPIRVPPVPGALEPSVSLDYDSQEVDGLTSSTNNQASWIGDGWGYEPGFIERDYQACSEHDSRPAPTRPATCAGTSGSTSRR